VAEKNILVFGFRTIMSVSYSHHASGSSGNQYRIPDELQEILLDFTVNYLIEQPTDIAKFGIEYFVKLTAARTKNEDDNSDDESMLSDEETRRNGINMQGSSRRKSVFAETYDPEEDEQDDQSVRSI
jgi:cAMP-dependent protein kinase regulator